MTIVRLRDSARPTSNGSIHSVNGCCVQEYASFSRAIAMGAPPRTEIEFRPGTAYRIFTGIGMEGVVHGLQLVFRAVEAAYTGFGLCVERADVIRGELTFVVTVQDAHRFRVSEPLVEFAVRSEAVSFVAPVEAEATVDAIPVTSINAQVPAPDRQPVRKSDEELQRMFMESPDDLPAASTTVITAEPSVPPVAPHRVKPYTGA